MRHPTPNEIRAEIARAIREHDQPLMKKMGQPDQDYAEILVDLFPVDAYRVIDAAIASACEKYGEYSC